MTEPLTVIAPSRLAELRAEGRAKAGPFVDPRILQKCLAVIGRRGKAWTSAILGRDLSRRSLLSPAQPYLLSGDEYTIIAADVEEDRARFDQIIQEN